MEERRINRHSLVAIILIVYSLLLNTDGKFAKCYAMENVSWKWLVIITLTARLRYGSIKVITLNTHSTQWTHMVPYKNQIQNRSDFNMNIKKKFKPKHTNIPIYKTVKIFVLVDVISFAEYFQSVQMLKNIPNIPNSSWYHVCRFENSNFM